MEKVQYSNLYWWTKTREGVLYMYEIQHSRNVTFELVPHFAFLLDNATR